MPGGIGSARLSFRHANIFRDAHGPLLPGGKEKRVAVRTPVRPQVRHIADEPQRHSRALHAEYFIALALRTISPFTDVPK